MGHFFLFSDESLGRTEAVKLPFKGIQKEDKLQFLILFRHMFIMNAEQSRTSSFSDYCQTQKIQKFQVRNIIQSYNMAENRKNWTDFEDKAILALVKRYGIKNWAEISEKMSTRYGIDSRSGKQCRERWHNHLDPAINKQEWSPKQQKMMFEAHQQYGNKWTEIAKMFPGRTDNDIKNHFYSMLRRSLRRINKMLGRRNSTQKIKVIKPSVLSKIFLNIGVQDERKSEECKKISQALFEFSKTKPDGDLTESLQFKEKRRLEELIEGLSHYNDEYELLQVQKRQSRKSQNSQTQLKPIQPVQSQAVITKKESQISSGSSKSKKIKRVIRRTKLASDETNTGSICKTRKQSNLKKKKKQEQQKKFLSDIAEQKEKMEDEKDVEKFYMTRLRKNQSGLSLGDQFMLPDLSNIPQESGKNSSSSYDSMRFKKNSGIFTMSPGFSMNNNANSNLFTGPSPRGQFRNWTPLCPSPNISDLFSRGGMNYEWKPNKEQMDEVLESLRRQIQEQSSRPD